MNGIAWSAWEWLGGGFNSDPSAVSWRDGSDRVDVFARGLDGEFVAGRVDGIGLERLARTRRRVRRWDGRDLHRRRSPACVYGIGTDGGLRHEVWNGSGWSGWSTLEGQRPTDPAAVSPPGSGSVELFMIGADAAAERLIEGP